MQVIVHSDPESLAEAAADFIAGAVDSAPDRFSLGLAGGSTPLATYRVLRGRDLDWHKVDAWMSDERWVPLDHPECNGHQAATALMDHVGARFFRPRWAPWLTPADSAAHFEATLRSLHPDGRADLILLGMGDDGHTASLFPGTAALDAPESRWYVDNYVPKLDAHRLTATYRFLRAAHRILFLVTGEAKAPALRQVLEPADGEEVLPARGVLGGDAEVIWMVDEAAASQLSSTNLVRH
ncbi:MAG: 6-phosphogluconolactonase [Acidimicrobiia bacterium]|nr:6-phosphogluconolactonase [Acidimicrobiia bacterium]